MEHGAVHGSGILEQGSHNLWNAFLPGRGRTGLVSGSWCHLLCCTIVGWSVFAWSMLGAAGFAVGKL